MKKFLLLATLLFVTSDAWAANRYWVGGCSTANWNCSDSGPVTNWGSASNTRDNVAAPTSADNVFFDGVGFGASNSTLNTNFTVTSLNMTGYSNTLTHSSNSQLTVSGGNVTFSGTMTYSPAASSSNIAFTTTGTITTNGIAIYALTSTAGGFTITLGSNLTFVAQKDTSFSGLATINLNGYTISGNSSINRVLIRSTTLGTARTITNTTGTFANADFKDITFSTNADYSAITGKSGDCGGNSGATLTTGTTQTYTGGTGSWSDVTKWTSRVPLPQDDVSMSGVTGGTITADMPRLGKSIDWTGASGSPTWSANTVAMTLYGDLKLISGMTFTTGSTGTWAFEGRGTHTITMAGKSIYQATIQAFGGTYSFADAINVTSNTFSLANGTLNFGSYTHSFFDFASSNANTRTINLESSTISLSRASTSWNCVTATNLTLNAGTSEIRVGGSVSGFAGGGRTYNNVRITASATTLVITGANTFNRIYTDGGGTKSITIPGSTTTTILSGQGLANGSNVITFTASAGSATVSKPGGGNVDWRAVNLTNIIANTATGANYFAGGIPPSTDGGGNIGWIFKNAPNTKGRSGSMRNLFFDEVPRSRMAYV